MTARQRFVEAMRRTPQPNEWTRQAAIAFVDANCQGGSLEWECEEAGEIPHAACRASLLKECGLQITVDSGGE